MIQKVPTLSRNGWIDDTNLRINKIFEHFLASEYSQSNLHYKEVASLKYLLATTNKTLELKGNIEHALTRLFKNYFQNVNVWVDVNEPDNSGTMTLSINVEITENNERYTASRAVESKLGKITNFQSEQTILYEMYLQED